MERGHATVRAVVRGLDQADALVEVESAGCGRCHEEGGCGGNNLTQMFCSGKRLYRVTNTIGASVDEHVIVDISPGSISRSANIAYGIPLGLVLLFAMLGGGIFGDIGAMVGAAAGFLIAMAVLRIKMMSGTGNQMDRPYIVSRI